MSKVHFALALTLATGAIAAPALAGSGAATTPVWATHPLAIPGPALAEAGAVRRLAQATAAPATSAGSATPPAPAADRSGPTTSGGRGSAVTAGTESGERYTDCVRLWDSGTHMSKQAWARTCRRIENRLQNLQVENLDVDSMGAKARKKRKSPDAG